MNIPPPVSPYTARRHYRPLRQSVNLWSYAPVVVVIALRLASDGTANVSYLIIAAYALGGRSHAIRALALSWLFGMINPGIAPEASLAPIGRYAVIAGAAISILLHGGFFRGTVPMRGFVFLTLLLGLYIVGHSMILSPMVDVSVLKASTWTIAMATILAAWIGLTDEGRERLAIELFCALAFILVVSLPLIALPVGYLRNGTGFQGILNHPQTFGPTIALLGSWAASRLFGERRPQWSSTALVGACLFAVLMSEARTAGLAMVFGVVLSVFFAPGFAGKSIGRMAPGLGSARLWTVLTVTFVVGIAMAPTIAGMTQHYITKSGRSSAEGLWEAYDMSRGGKIAQMVDNIEQRPLTGIGFGLASEPALMVISRDPILGLPVGASIEKGVAPIAVLEELGVPGALLVAFWVWRLMRSSARGGLAPFAVCLTVLLLNLGESTLFSPGGFGMLSLVLLGWAFASGSPLKGLPTRA